MLGTVITLALLTLSPAQAIAQAPELGASATAVCHAGDLSKLAPAEAAEKYYQEGNRRILQGRHEEAAICFDAALQTDSNHAESHRGLGIAYSRLRKTELALKHYESYLAMAPKAQDADKVRDLITAYKQDLASKAAKERATAAPVR